MNSELTWLKSLDRGPGPTPRVDVTDAVMATLRSLPAEDNRVFSFAAAAALVAGALCVGAAMWEQLAPQAPLAALADYFYPVLR